MKPWIWKQWQEDRMVLALFTVWMLMAACYCTAYECGYRFRASVGQFSAWAQFYAITAAIVMALRTAQGELAAGTFSFTAALPVSLRRVATVRLAGAIFTLAVPLVLAATLLWCALLSGLITQVEPRHPEAYQQLPLRATASTATAVEQLAGVTWIAIFGGLELLLALSIAGCWMRGLGPLGLLGAVMGVASIMATDVLWSNNWHPRWQLICRVLFPQSLVIHYGYEAQGGGSYCDHELAPHHWAALGLALVVLATLACLFVTLYSRVPRSVRRTPLKQRWLSLPTFWSRIPTPWLGRRSALIWFELRQSLPLVVCGLLFAVLLAWMNTIGELSPPPNGPALTHPWGESVRAQLPGATMFIGMLWASVVGSALYAAELGDGLGAFWRSRPIAPSQWFWYKFFTGLLVILCVLDGVTVLVAWHASREEPTLGMSWAYLGCFPVLHALMYAIAVLGTCWLRKPVIGALGAIIVFGLVDLVLGTFPLTESLEPIEVYNGLLWDERRSALDFAQHGYPLVYGTFGLVTVAMACFASHLARPFESSSKG